MLNWHKHATKYTIPLNSLYKFFNRKHSKIGYQFDCCIYRLSEKTVQITHLSKEVDTRKQELSLIQQELETQKKKNNVSILLIDFDSLDIVTITKLLAYINAILLKTAT